MQAESTVDADAMCGGKQNTGFKVICLFYSHRGCTYRLVVLSSSSMEETCTAKHLPRLGLFFSIILLCPSGVHVSCSSHRLPAEIMDVTSEPRSLNAHI